MSGKLKHREFITLLGGAAVAWPLAVGAQTLRHRPLVGSLQVQSLAGSARYASEFLRGMAELGYVDRILRGEKAGELPVQAPTRYELVITSRRRRRSASRCRIACSPAPTR